MKNMYVEFEESFEIGPEGVIFKNCTPSSMNIDEIVLVDFDFSRVGVRRFSVERSYAWDESDSYIGTHLDLFLNSEDKNAVLKLHFRNRTPDLKALIDIMESQSSLTISYRSVSVESEDLGLNAHTELDVVFNKIYPLLEETIVWKASPDWIALHKHVINEEIHQ